MAKVPLSLVDSYADKYDIPRPIFRGLVKEESGFNPEAVGPATKYGRAEGLTQLLPGTAKALGVSNPLDANQNLDGGARYLKQNYDKFGSWPLAVAAHNAGPGAVEKYGGIPPYKETQNYVRAIMGSASSDQTASPSHRQSVDAVARAPQEQVAAKPAPGQMDPHLASFLTQASPEKQEAIKSAGQMDPFLAGFLPSLSPSEQNSLPLDNPGSMAHLAGRRDLTVEPAAYNLRSQIQRAVQPQPISVPNGVPASAASPSVPPTATAPVTQNQGPDLVAASYGLLPSQVLNTLPGNVVSSSSTETNPTSLPTDAISRQTSLISQTATGPLAQTVKDYAQRTGGRDYVHDLVIRYLRAPAEYKPSILQEADAYGLKNTVLGLSQVGGSL